MVAFYKSLSVYVISKNAWAEVRIEIQKIENIDMLLLLVKTSEIFLVNLSLPACRKLQQGLQQVCRRIIELDQKNKNFFFQTGWLTCWI